MAIHACFIDFSCPEASTPARLQTRHPLHAGPIWGHAWPQYKDASGVGPDHCHSSPAHKFIYTNQVLVHWQAAMVLSWYRSTTFQYTVQQQQQQTLPTHADRSARTCRKHTSTEGNASGLELKVSCSVTEAGSCCWTLPAVLCCCGNRSSWCL